VQTAVHVIITGVMIALLTGIAMKLRWTEPVSGACDLAPVVEDIRSCGATSLRAIAGELNARGMLTRRGGAGTSPP